MAGTTSKVDYAAMKQAEGLVGNAIGSLQGMLQESERNIAAIEVAWSGHASGGFVSALETWGQDFKACVDELQRIDSCLGGNKKILIQSEDANSADVQALAQQLEA